MGWFGLVRKFYRYHRGFYRASQRFREIRGSDLFSTKLSDFRLENAESGLLGLFTQLSLGPTTDPVPVPREVGFTFVARP